MSAVKPLCMLLALLYSTCRTAALLILALPRAIISCLSSSTAASTKTGGVLFYEGTVKHVRKRPVHNAFQYPVRMALVDLNQPPYWWAAQAACFYTADEVRNLAGTKGKVLVFTNPVTAGYLQNPISVYYCHSQAGALQICLAEVTNTPWGARVSFLFDPKGQSVPKALHVSPLMDMQSQWHLNASNPGKRLNLFVSVTHPELGDYFRASFEGRVSDCPHLRSEEADFTTLLRYGFQPQRDALLIYWQALKLLWKGVPFFSPPEESFKVKVEQAATNPRLAEGAYFLWRRAKCFPWNLDQ